MTTMMMRCWTTTAAILLATVVFTTTIIVGAIEMKTSLRRNNNRGLRIVEYDNDCTEVPPEPIWKETIGNLSKESSYLDDAVQIITTDPLSKSKDVQTVTFTVSQLWLEEPGAPMISVHYRSDGEEVCDMKAAATTTTTPTTLIEYGATEEYTAECSNGYAEISIYVYVGNVDDFNVDECESCSAPNMDYVGHYLTLPCVPICEPEMATNAPDPEDPATPPPICPADVTLLRTIGTTDFPINHQAVQIVSQDTETVTVELHQAWTTATTDHIFVSYKDTPFDKHCFETENVRNGLYDTVTIMCNILSPKAYLEVCVVDDLGNGILSENDTATVPKCCYPDSVPDNKPVVCYSLAINCVTECVDIDVDESQQ